MKKEILSKEECSDSNTMMIKILDHTKELMGPLLANNLATMPKRTIANTTCRVKLQTETIKITNPDQENH